MTKPPPPARLFVLLARQAPIGVILRRGPTEWVQMILWDTRQDIFITGQWFHGRVYVERCDLSPDGALLLYFASQYTRKTLREDKIAWTAVSKPPFFTALEIHFQSDTWGGGGLFETGRQWIASTDHPALQNWVMQNCRTAAVAADATITLTVDRIRRLSDGWLNIARSAPTKSTGWVRLTWQKTVGQMALIYTESRYTAYPPYPDCYTLKPDGQAAAVPLAGVVWADFDQQGRLVLAKDGKLFAGTLDNDALQLTELADFNAHKPEPVVAPEWAQKWE